MLDVQLFGAWAGGHHATSVLLHVLNSLLLFQCLRRMTRTTWQSAWVAALFALHPMHVESVAWVSERKDVLSTFFGLLSMRAYIAHAQGSPRSMRLAEVFLVLSLMSKPMLVTLPFVFLLLDYWPLRRLEGLGPRRLVLEKIPLFLLSAASSVVTVVAQQSGGALRSIEVVPLGLRLANAAHSYLRYLGKMLWPSELSMLYPHPYVPGTGAEPLSELSIVAAFGLLLVISFLILRVLGRAYASVGWLWFLGTLVPVIGLVQVGNQALADRYSYVPSIGLFIIVAWGGADLASALRTARPWAGWAVAASATALLCASTAAAWIQTGYWRDSLTLFEHAVEVTPQNSMVHNGMTASLVEQGRFAQAELHGLRALEIKPDYVSAMSNLGNALRGQQRHREALRRYRSALAIEPDHPSVRFNLANALSSLGRWEAAVGEYQRSLTIEPDNADCWHNLGNALRAQGRLEEAASHYQRALEADPRAVISHYMLGRVRAEQDRYRDAALHYRRALEIDPTYAPARRSLERALDGR
jgi:tetratricopeptide (TPR) repeat protein